MNPHARTALDSIESLTRPHIGGHRCTSGTWYNDQVPRGTSCPVRVRLTETADAVRRLHDAVHEAAHSDDTVRAVTEAMTSTPLTEYAPDAAEGWLHLTRRAIEALAAHLDGEA